MLTIDVVTAESELTLTTHVLRTTHCERSFLKRLAITIGVSLVCLPATYLINYRNDFNKTFRNESLAVDLHLMNFHKQLP